MSQSLPALDLPELPGSCEILESTDEKRQSLGSTDKPYVHSSDPTNLRNRGARFGWGSRALIFIITPMLGLSPEFELTGWQGPNPDVRHGPGFQCPADKLAEAAIHNLQSFRARCIHLFLKPKDLAPPALDLFSFFLSILWMKREHGPDILYPFASLQKQRSERLARLLADHSGSIQHQNIRVATSRIHGVDSPRVVVIDLNEVSPKIAEREYSVPADFHGFWVVLLLLSVANFFWFISHLQNYDVVTEADNILFISLVFFVVHLGCLFLVIGVAAHGNGFVTLLRKSDISTPGCAVLLDRDLTVVLVGPQNIVEAIGESNFSMSLSATQRDWHACREEVMVISDYLREVLVGACEGIPSLILAGLVNTAIGYLRLPDLQEHAFAIAVIPSIVRFSSTIKRRYRGDFDTKDAGGEVSVLLSIILVLPLHGLATHTRSPSLSFSIILPFMSILSIIMCISSNIKYHIRTVRFLDILGRPPVRRWEFNTLAAAATFQCLAICRGIPRPVKNIDVLGLLDTFVVDNRDVWKAWKDRVADRIAHEDDILFAPTIPTFGDPERQKRLKQLLDEAQEGYLEYRKFYDHHMPLYPMSQA